MNLVITANLFSVHVRFGDSSFGRRFIWATVHFPDGSFGRRFTSATCLLQTDSSYKSIQYDEAGAPHSSLLKKTVRRLVNLAYLPPSNVTAAYEELVDDVLLELEPYLDYHEDIWIGRIRANGSRRQSRYPLTVWNQREAAAAGNMKSNYYVM